MKRKQEEVEIGQQEKKESVKCNTHGDGAQWLRGSMIGKGSFGSVFLANLKPNSRYSYLPPIMAVKSADVSVSGSLQKEKEVLNNLQTCPYIIQCFGEEITSNDNGGMVYNLLLEYASGGDLASVIKKSNGGRLPDSDVRCYTRSILRGINHIHESGYVHCDLKPQNVLLVPTSSSKFVATVGDFGSAKRVKQSKRSKLNPYLRGTSLYLSPEAVVDNVQEPPSDIWALGCVVLEMLTGKPAWDRRGDSNSNDNLLSRIANASAGPNIPDEIPEMAKSFLKGCFVREAKSRMTAETLLNHAFVGGLDEDIDEEVEEVIEVASDGEDKVCSSASLSDEDDLEVSDSYCSNDSSYFSEDDLSWSRENRVRNIPLFCNSNHKAAIGGPQHTGMKICTTLAGS